MFFWCEALGFHRHSVAQGLAFLQLGMDQTLVLSTIKASVSVLATFSVPLAMHSLVSSFKGFLMWWPCAFLIAVWNLALLALQKPSF